MIQDLKIHKKNNEHIKMSMSLKYKEVLAFRANFSYLMNEFSNVIHFS